MRTQTESLNKAIPHDILDDLATTKANITIVQVFKTSPEQRIKMSKGMRRPIKKKERYNDAEMERTESIQYIHGTDNSELSNDVYEIEEQQLENRNFLCWHLRRSPIGIQLLLGMNMHNFKLSSTKYGITTPVGILTGKDLLSAGADGNFLTQDTNAKTVMKDLSSWSILNYERPIILLQSSRRVPVRTGGWKWKINSSLTKSLTSRLNSRLERRYLTTSSSTAE
ncbi:1467_t:CDS:2 [Ambispora gerdemannii]|uniref:1467_t:CDS:1 n=1 Tax=Ambispora gerdemannii TaxID=144530 RepID=A0A9N9AHT7_9GLOM|nr:1467_t:CDS:2 [Ambispora gerdemannii]